MPIITDIEVAKTRLKFELQFDTPPELTDEGDGNDIDRILAKWKRASVWTSATVFVAGDIVIPATQNGHRFRCVTSGTSGSSEPSWSTSDFSSVGDGTAQWQEDGKQYDLWDMEMAVNYGWSIKKSKAVVYIGSEDGLSDIYNNCAEMERQTKPARVA